MDKKIAVSFLILFFGIVISGVLAFSDFSTSESIANTESLSWTQAAGAGVSVPACGSSSNLAPTCVGSSPSVTINWSWAVNAAHPRECNLANVGIYKGGVQVQGYQRACNDSITWTGGESNTSYTYNVYFLDVDGNPAIETASGSFSTPNCTLPPVCSPSSVSLNTGQAQTFSVSEGSLPFTWDAPSSSNPSGSGTTHNTSYSSSGSYSVSVTDSAARNSQCSVRVSSGPPAPACTLAFNPSRITSGDPTTAIWTSNDSDGIIPYSCTGDLGSGNLTSASGEISNLRPAQSQTCSLTINGQGNICSGGITVSAVPPPPPPPPPPPGPSPVPGPALSVTNVSCGATGSISLAWTTEYADEFGASRPYGDVGTDYWLHMCARPSGPNPFLRCTAYGEFFSLDSFAIQADRRSPNTYTFNNALNGNNYSFALFVWNSAMSEAASGWSNIVSRDISCAALNQPPAAEAGISLNGVLFSQSITVTRGAPVTIWLSADRDISGDGFASRDPDGWTSANGVSSGGRCDLNIDLRRPGFFVQRTVSNPASPSSCNQGSLSKVFNDPPGTYLYEVLRVTDAPGAQSNIATVLVNVISPVSMSLIANPPVINIGDSSTLTWETEGFGLGECTIDRGIGSVAPRGSRPVSPIVTTTYTLSCSNAFNSASTQATVYVSTIPIIKEIPPR